MSAAVKRLAPFITLEGGEGAGKSTQLGLLAQRITEAGLRVNTTFEPGATELGADLRRLVSEPRQPPPSPRAELLMYLADRAQHVAAGILPALESGVVVLCDRFTDSSEVYQGRARGLGWEEVRKLNRWVCGDVWPDLTLLLDLEPELGLGRALKRQGESGLDRMELEALGFHQAVRRGFLEQAAAEPERIKIIDAGMSIDRVAQEIWLQCEPLVKRWRADEA